MNIDDLEKLYNLKKKGILTEEEFERQKRIILDNVEDNVDNIVFEKKKNVWEYYLDGFRKTGTRHRTTRREYWSFQLIHFLIALFLLILLPVKTPLFFSFLPTFTVPSIVFPFSNAILVSFTVLLSFLLFFQFIQDVIMI